MSTYLLEFGSYRYTLSDVHDDRAAAKLLGTLRSGQVPAAPIAVDELIAPLQINPKRWPNINITKPSDPE